MGERIVYRDEGVEPRGDVLEFRLTYNGELFSTRIWSERVPCPAPGCGHVTISCEKCGHPLAPPRAKSKNDHKHDLRKAFHRQIKKLWMEDHRYSGEFKVQVGETLTTVEQRARRFPPVNEFRFVPFLLTSQRMNCSLDILYLRKGPRGSVIGKADIDNRIKTIIDALTMPTLNQLDPTARPEADEDPFFVLLEDDVLVTRLAVETDTLLEPTPSIPPVPEQDDSRVVISVRTWHD
jgi:hypothetical protein